MNTYKLSPVACKEIEANMEMAAMLSGNEEVISKWAARDYMECNGTMINDLIRLARTMKAN